MTVKKITMTERCRPHRAYCIDGQRVGIAWVEERRVSNGFEMIRIQILTQHVDLVAGAELKEPGVFYRAVCAMYPLDPRPSPPDILSVEIERINKPLHHTHIVLTIRRGHYIGGPDSSIPHYEWEDYDHDGRSNEDEVPSHDLEGSRDHSYTRGPTE